jgi:hypothetical protein
MVLFIVVSLVPLVSAMTMFGNGSQLNANLQIRHAALCKNQNCLRCEAVLPKYIGNLANHRNEPALSRSLASPVLTGLALCNLSMLNFLGQTLNSEDRPVTTGAL